MEMRRPIENWLGVAPESCGAGQPTMRETPESGERFHRQSLRSACNYDGFVTVYDGAGDPGDAIRMSAEWHWPLTGGT